MPERRVCWSLLTALRRLFSITPAVVVPTSAPEWISRSLDSGVQIVIVPHVNTVTEAEMCVGASKFPPVVSDCRARDEVSSEVIGPSFSHHGDGNDTVCYWSQLRGCGASGERKRDDHANDRDQRGPGKCRVSLASSMYMPTLPSGRLQLYRGSMRSSSVVLIFAWSERWPPGLIMISLTLFCADWVSREITTRRSSPARSTKWCMRPRRLPGAIAKSSWDWEAWNRDPTCWKSLSRTTHL